MKLDPDGKTRLDAMKKALAAGLPLAGLLAASAAVGAASQGCKMICPPMGRFPAEVQEPWETDGEVVEVERGPLPAERYVTMGLRVSPGIPEKPEVPEESGTPEAPADE